VAKQAEQYGVPQVIPAASKEEITRQGYKWVYRVNAPGEVYAHSLIDAALAFGKPKTVAFIYESTDFGASLSKVGKAYAGKKGLTVVADEAYQAGSPDYRSTLTKIKEKNPDLVFMVSYVADAILLMRQSKEIGLKPQAFLGGGAGFDTAQFESETAISTNVFSVTQWTPDSNAKSEEFTKRYQAKFGKRPTYHAACTYTAMTVAAEAAAKGGGNREKVRAALASGTWQDLLGEVKFEAYDGYNNQNRNPMPVIQYQGGKSVTVYPPNVAKAKAVYPFPGWK
jgi:branched-chain amino acid transport system substrate-binding protein